MKKIIQLILILVFTLLFSELSYADEDDPEDDSGSSTPTPICSSFNIGLQCTESQTSVALTWGNADTSASQFTVYWDRDPNRDNCPAGSPVSVCGSTTLVTRLSDHGFTALIRELTPRQSYKFRVNSAETFTCKIASNYETTQQVNISAANLCTPTICGDNTKGTTEACDGTDFGTQLNNATNQCNQYGGQQNPNRPYEGGNLTCVNNNQVCQITTTSCIDCNGLSNITFSNNVNTSGYIAANAPFTCFVDAVRVGPGITCEIIDNIYSAHPDITNIVGPPCNFVRWQPGTTRAEFNCTAPSQTLINTNPYTGLRTRYPIQSGSTSGTVVGTSCPLQTKITNSPSQPRFVAADTTPPTVVVRESYADYTNENPQSELKAEVYCSDTGSGCYPESYKLKRFDTQPTSCPTNYSDYTLTSPNALASSKPVWYCAAAQDVLGNTGFSTALEIRPGCRDECRPLDNRQCRGAGDGENKVSYECHQDADQDTCYEMVYDNFCGEYCDWGTCNTSIRIVRTGPDIIRMVVGHGRTLDTEGNSIQGITIRWSAYPDGRLDNEASNSYSEYGDFIIEPFADSSSDGIYSGDYTIYTQTPPPPGYQLDRVFCSENGFDKGANCSLTIPFNGNNQILSFYFRKTDTTLPTGSLTKPSTITQQTPVTFSVTAADNIGVKDIEIYLDKGLAKRCHITQGSGIYDPHTSGTCNFATTFLSEDSHTAYAKITDTVGNIFTTPVQTFSVTTPGGDVGPLTKQANFGILPITTTTYTLTVNSSPTGIAITGSPTGSGGTTNYSRTVNAGTSHTLTVPTTPPSGYVFSSWAGCDSLTGTGNITCNITNIAANKIVTANYTPTYTLTVDKSPTAGGTITASGGTGPDTSISCGTNCVGTYNSGSIVTLSAAAATGYSFSRWSGITDCSDGSVTMDANKSCTAVFYLPDLIVDTLSPTNATPNSPITFSGRVVNQGNGRADLSDTRLRIDLNNDGSWDTTLTNQSTGSLNPLDPLASGSTETENWTWTTPSCAGTCTHKYEVYADIGAAVAESNEGNNWTTQILTVTSTAQPNLTATLNPVGTHTSGDVITFSGAVTNSGSANAEASSARFCIDSGSASNCFSSSTTGRVGTDQSVPGLNAGVSSPRTSGNWTAASGSHTAYLCADVTDAVTNESAEGAVNNCSSQSFTVLPPAPPPAGPSCAWIKTTGGDVHSNTGINRQCRL